MSIDTNNDPELVTAADGDDSEIGPEPIVPDEPADAPDAGELSEPDEPVKEHPAETDAPAECGDSSDSPEPSVELSVEPSVEPAEHAEYVDYAEPVNYFDDAALHVGPDLDSDCDTSLLWCVQFHLISEHGIPTALELSDEDAELIHAKLHVRPCNHTVYERRFRPGRAMAVLMLHAQAEHEARWDPTPRPTTPTSEMAVIKIDLQRDQRDQRDQHDQQVLAEAVPAGAWSRPVRPPAIPTQMSRQ